MLRSIRPTSEKTLSDHLDNVRKEMRSLLRAQNKRVTAARLAVLITLHEQAVPMSHEQIMEVLPEGMYDKASVWRVLSDLAECGALRRMDLGDRIWRYELNDACRTIAAEHSHFLCEDCGVVNCLPPLIVQASNGALPSALKGANYRIRVVGSCAQCVGA